MPADEPQKWNSPTGSPIASRVTDNEWSLYGNLPKLKVNESGDIAVDDANKDAYCGDVSAALEALDTILQVFGKSLVDANQLDGADALCELVGTIRRALAQQQPDDDDRAFALKVMENEQLYDDYDDEDLDRSTKAINIIRDALTTKKNDINIEILEALKLCLPRIEEIRIVDLGAVRDAEMQDYQERKVIARRELAETNELINKINSAIARAEQKGQ